MKADRKARKKVEALKRRKEMLDALTRFVKEHPEVTGEARLHALNGNTGLKFPHYALIVPKWESDKVALRLVKAGEDWLNSMGPDAYYGMERTVVEDVTGMSEKKIGKLLDRMFEEANPDEGDEEEDNE